MTRTQNWLLLAALGCVLACASACKASHEVQDSYFRSRLDAISVDLPSNVNPDSKRGKTFKYWQTAQGEVHICMDIPSLVQNKISYQRAGNTVVESLRKLPAEGVDEDAVRAIMMVANGIEGAARAELNTAIQSGGNAVGGNGYGVAEGLSGAAKGIAQTRDIKGQVDAQVALTRALLESRYGDSYAPITISGGCLAGLE
jgi:hypothetical protein